MRNIQLVMYNERAGRVYQQARPWKSKVYITWGRVLELSPNAIRPSNWPEPGGWFWGWNRREKLELKNLVRMEDG